MALRFSGTRLDASKITQTGAGAARVDAVVTSSGVFEYRDPDGKIVREYRPPEEVLKADSLATLRDLPVTERHPKTFVTPQSWRKDAIGHASGSARADQSAHGVAAALDLVVSDAAAIGKLGKDLVEISCGYRCDLEDTPGMTPSGQAYDRIQRNIQYNHIAVGPAHWGRQGSSVAMRLDSAGDELAPDGTPAAPSQHRNKETHMVKIRVDGVDFEGATAEEVQAKIDAHFASKSKTDAAQSLAAITAERDVLAKKLAAETARADAAPALAAAAIKARGELETQAQAVMGKGYKCDGKDDQAIKVEVIKHFDSTFDPTGKEPAYINASFDTWCRAGVKESRVDAGTRRILAGLNGTDGNGQRKPGERADGQEVDRYDSEAARERRTRRLDEAWQKPIKDCLTYDQAVATMGR